jgi:hypothetical protein
MWLQGKNEWSKKRRELLRLARACDQGKISPNAVATRMAEINFWVHTGEPTVGPRCVVAWRHRKQGFHNGGGAHQFYNGLKPESSSGPADELPLIANGNDLSAFFNVIMPHMREQMASLVAGKQAAEIDKDKMNAELAKLPTDPDERLR